MVKEDQFLSPHPWQFNFYFLYLYKQIKDMSNFLEQYKEDKKVRDLVKRRTFKCKSVNTNGYTWNNHDLDFKITHIKLSDKVGYRGSLDINVKVSGKMRTYSWRADSNGMADVSNPHNFRSAVSRNRDIRNHLEKEVARYLCLFGVERWKVEIGKVTISKSL